MVSHWAGYYLDSQFRVDGIFSVVYKPGMSAAVLRVR